MISSLFYIPFLLLLFFYLQNYFFCLINLLLENRKIENYGFTHNLDMAQTLISAAKKKEKKANSHTTHKN